MLGASILYIGFSGFDKNKSIIVLLICIIKMIDVIEDVFHGFLQQKNKLDIAGKLLTVRNIVTIVIFCTALILLKELLVVCLLTAIIYLLVCLTMNIKSASEIKNRIRFFVTTIKKVI